MGAVVYWEYMDGSCGEKHFGGNYKAAEEFARTAFEGQPVRVWCCGDIVQRGFIASDERGEPA